MENKLVIGILAHVDAGKTTLSEGMLYLGGSIRKMGRVDHGNAFLDTYALERARGITIFSKQAVLNMGKWVVTLLDTPGHVDFSAEMERTLSVLDYAVLVINGADGVQGHTQTLWRLLHRYRVPVFLFVNKMDQEGTDREALMEELKQRLDDSCVDFTEEEARLENIAMCEEAALEEYLETGGIAQEEICRMIAERKVFPCYFGSALRMTGVEEFMMGLAKYVRLPVYLDGFGARVFKISHDDKGNRLSWVRVFGGKVPAKSVLLNEEKVNQIRIYNGAKFTPTQVLNAGQVGALTGLTSTAPGLGLGKTKPLPAPVIKPVLNYAVKVNKEDLHACLNALKELEDEDPQLQISWHPHIQEIHVQIMGEVQLQILQQLLQERYQLEVTFDEGNVLYQETITNKVEGVGHFEPLRHYAEAHLLLEPGKQGSEITISSDCSLDILDRNWQHQILTSLQAKEHLGVLTGAPLTDVKITLIGGRGHIKHTVGGDFRQASWRAVRQGLMELKGQNECQLLEPWYAFHLKVPNDQVGRAINDIQQMHGTFELDEANSQALTLITGTAPVVGMRDYAQSVRAYTHGQGQLELVVAGYYPCHNAEDVIRNVNYDPVADLENTPDSVFCAHGAGFPVPWNEVPTMAHYPYRK